MLADRVAKRDAMGGIDGLAAAMATAAVVVAPMGGWQAIGVAADPLALLAGVGVGVASSVIPDVRDQLALARLRRASYALLGEPVERAEPISRPRAAPPAATPTPAHSPARAAASRS